MTCTWKTPGPQKNKRKKASLTETQLAPAKKQSQLGATRGTRSLVAFALRYYNSHNLFRLTPIPPRNDHRERK